MQPIFDAARGRRERRLCQSVFVGMIVATAGLIPPLLNGQDLNDTTLNGTRLTYFPSATAANCKSDCTRNIACRGWTWIKPGGYKPGDPPMCYLMSSVTSQVQYPCCISGIKTGVSGTAIAQYLGCFKDTNRPLDLDGYLEASASNTPERCIETCRQKGFTYAGVQNGQSCLCGNSYGRYGEAANCNIRCTGYSSVNCGGAYANSVFSTGAGPSAPPPPPPPPPQTGGNLTGRWRLSTTCTYTNPPWSAIVQLSQAADGALNASTSEDKLNAALQLPYPAPGNWGTTMISQVRGSQFNLALRPNGWLSVLEFTGTVNGSRIDGRVHHEGTVPDCNFTMVRQ